MTFFQKKGWGLVFFVVMANPAHATHLVAGEIQVNRISVAEPTYLIRVVLYSDSESPVVAGQGTIFLGDGTFLEHLDAVGDQTVEVLGNGIMKNTFTLEHTYPVGPENYTIGYEEGNRTSKILNIADANTPFYIETTFLVETPCAANSTPVLLIPPIDFAPAGELFFHNPGGYDPDGDSISYELVEPLQGPGQTVIGYFFPHGLELEPTSGDLVWQVPNTQGEYTLALLIREWRIAAGIPILQSTTTRDMQIRVRESQGLRPEISIPPDTCIVAGEVIVADIIATDPNKNQTLLEAFSQTFFLKDSPAQINPDRAVLEKAPAIRTFSWETTADHIRAQSYSVHYKASGGFSSSFPLVDFKTWNIQVTAPAPGGLTLELLAAGPIQVSWQPYVLEAEQIQIWRRVVPFDIARDACAIGIPFYAGYRQVGQLPGSEVEFQDIHSTGRFARGARYCYRLLAKIPGCTDTPSAPSEEVCLTIPADAPVITHASVVRTDTADGEVLVRWTSSFDLDTTALMPGRFTYRLQRGYGFDWNGLTTIVTPPSYTDTTFVDRGLNTRDSVFNYTVFLFQDEALIDSSATASSVRLDGEFTTKDIRLNWLAEVPWSINTQKYPHHYIYRGQTDGNEEQLLFLDSIDVNLSGFHYTDSGGLGAGSYCYYVTTAGSYGNARIVEPLLNSSQIFCIALKDTIPPCAPQVTIRDNTQEECNLFLSGQPCDFDDFFNDLMILPGCDENDIAGYNVYYARQPDSAFDLAAFAPGLSFRHQNLPSFIGCYRVTAIDLSGNESEASSTACRDYCPSLGLPNVFTPNGDGVNEVFTEFGNNPSQGCPRFVRQVEFSVVNRYGVEVFCQLASNEQDRWILWNGLNNQGHKVTPGVYYYQAQVTFDVLNPAVKVKDYKGWIQVVY